MSRNKEIKRPPNAIQRAAVSFADFAGWLTIVDSSLLRSYFRFQRNLHPKRRLIDNLSLILRTTFPTLLRVITYTVFAVSYIVLISLLFKALVSPTISFEVFVALVVVLVLSAYFVTQDRPHAHALRGLYELPKFETKAIKIPYLQKSLPVTLLLAEDQETNRRLRSLVEALGRQVVVVGEVSDGKEVLQQAFSLKPDLILMDVQMPSLSGLEVVREISKNLVNTKVVILSGTYSPEIEREAIKAGALGYLQKENFGIVEITKTILLALSNESKHLSHPSKVKVH